MRQGIRRTAVVVVSIALVASGCTTTSRVWIGGTSAAAVLPRVDENDHVRLLMRSGQDRNCRIRGYDAEFVYGCKDPVALQDIQEVRVRRLDGSPVLTVADLRLDDELTVHMRNGDMKRFRLQAIEAGVLRGEGIEVMVSEVDRATVTRDPERPGTLRVLVNVAAVMAAAGAVFVYLVVKGSEGSD
jgi:hypothetical protein